MSEVGPPPVSVSAAAAADRGPSTGPLLEGGGPRREEALEEAVEAPLGTPLVSPAAAAPTDYRDRDTETCMYTATSPPPAATGDTSRDRNKIVRRQQQPLRDTYSGRV